MYNKPTDRILEAFHLGNKERYKEFRALNDVSFEVKKGETVGIIGTNGAGKSTLLKIITGVLSSTLGEVTIKEKFLLCWNLEQVSMMNIRELRTSI